jgi:hypothetical protein
MNPRDRQTRERIIAAAAVAAAAANKTTRAMRRRRWRRRRRRQSDIRCFLKTAQAGKTRQQMGTAVFIIFPRTSNSELKFHSAVVYQFSSRQYCAVDFLSHS